MLIYCRARATGERRDRSLEEEETDVLIEVRSKGQTYGYRKVNQTIVGRKIGATERTKSKSTLANILSAGNLCLCIGN